eukprot:gene16099-22241_t
MLSSKASIQGSAVNLASGILYAANIYISEGRDIRLINHIKSTIFRDDAGSTIFRDAGVHNESALVNTFVDEEYNRTGFTILSRSAVKLSETAVQLSELALSKLDLRTHVATHPRLGVVDHISIHPLAVPESASTSQGGVSKTEPSASTSSKMSSRMRYGEAAEQATLCAQWVGERLGSGGGGLPVYYYGWAHPQERRLAEVRRKLGYFKRQNQKNGAPEPLTPVHSNADPDYFKSHTQKDSYFKSNTQKNGAPEPKTEGTKTLWEGALPISGDLTHYPPDKGPGQCSEKAGLITIGSLPWIINYNVPPTSSSLSEKGAGLPSFEAMPWPSLMVKLTKVMSRSLSERGGGLPSVEAMALTHGEGEIEVACNLLDPESPVSSPDAVQKYLEELGRQAGLSVGAGYKIGRSPQEYISMATRMLNDPQ